MTNRYRLAPGVKWAVNRFSLAVADGQGRAWTIAYPEAAVWDLFTRGYSFAKVVTMVGHIATLGDGAADALVRESIEEWARQGLLEPAADRVIPMRAI